MNPNAPTGGERKNLLFMVTYKLNDVLMTSQTFHEINIVAVSHRRLYVPMILEQLRA